MWWFDGIWDTQSGSVVRAKQRRGAAACNPGENTERDSAG